MLPSLGEKEPRDLPVRDWMQSVGFSADYALLMSAIVSEVVSFFLSETFAEVLSGPRG
jgi:hypothetical protein